jgi:hypothetical protein
MLARGLSMWMGFASREYFPCNVFSQHEWFPPKAKLPATYIPAQTITPGPLPVTPGPANGPGRALVFGFLSPLALVMLPDTVHALAIDIEQACDRSLRSTGLVPLAGVYCEVDKNEA